MKTTWLHSIRLSVVAICVVAISGIGAVSAQQQGDVWADLGESFSGAPARNEESQVVGNTYVLPTSGAEVVLAEGLEPEDSDFEDQVIVSIPQGMGAVAVIPGLGTPQSVMDAYATGFSESVEGLVEIDVQADQDFATGLYSVDLVGLSMFLFITVDSASFPGYMTIQVAVAERNIADTIAFFRENIALEGQPVFSGIDEEEIQDMADEFIAM